MLYAGTYAVDTLEVEIEYAAEPLAQLAQAIELKPTVSDVLSLWRTYAPVFWELVSVFTGFTGSVSIQ